MGNDTEMRQSHCQARCLNTARQTHGEDRFSIVGSHGHLTPMRPGNLADDIQSKAEARLAVIAIILSKPPFERIKDIVQILFLNRWPAVPYLNSNVRRVTGKHH